MIAITGPNHKNKSSAGAPRDVRAVVAVQDLHIAGARRRCKRTRAAERAGARVRARARLHGDVRRSGGGARELLAADDLAVAWGTGGDYKKATPMNGDLLYVATAANGSAH